MHDTYISLLLRECALGGDMAQAVISASVDVLTHEISRCESAVEYAQSYDGFQSTIDFMQSQIVSMRVIVRQLRRMKCTLY